ncbi:MAG: VOC family protein [Candidatus Sericytochromatia bacterium]|nr:VOC family protein [Candidatus Sericytochromatia bacterium]
MPSIAPCIWCPGNAELVAEFYTGLFVGGAIQHTSHYTSGMPLPAGTVLLVEFSIAGQTFQALNGEAPIPLTPSLSFFVEADTADELRRLFGPLVEGGEVLMPLDAYPWSPCYAWVRDRFGVSWQLRQVEAAPAGVRILPSLMYSDAQRGRARDAIALYTGLFPDSEVLAVEHHGEGGHLIALARLRLGPQPLVVMDSPIDHGFTFTEGLSLSVCCTDQAEVDRLWDVLTAGGRPGPCGWLQDRFGVSWQIVPAALIHLQRQGNEVANARMFQAMLGMGRLDLATLERAWHGDPRRESAAADAQPGQGAGA